MRTLVLSLTGIIHVKARTDLQLLLCCHVADATFRSERPEACIIEIVDMACYRVIRESQLSGGM